MVLPAIPIEIGRDTIAKILPCGDLEGASDVIHQSLMITKQLQEKMKNCKRIFGPAKCIENNAIMGKDNSQFTALNHICTG